MFIPINATNTPVIERDEGRLRRPTTGRYSLSSTTPPRRLGGDSPLYEGSVFDRPRSLPSSPRKVTSTRSLDSAHQHNDGDVLLRVGGHTFKVHSTILRLASPVFAAMFSAPWSENNTPHTVELKEDDPRAIAVLLDAVYPSSALQLDNWADIPMLLRVADKYDVSKLKSAIGKHLIDFDDEIRNNPLEALRYAEECGAPFVYSTASRYALGHFPLHVKDPQFARLSSNTLAKLSRRFAEFTDALTTFEFRLYDSGQIVTCKYKTHDVSNGGTNGNGNSNGSGHTVSNVTQTNCTLALHTARDHLLKKYKELSSTSVAVPLSRVSHLASTPQTPISFGHNPQYSQHHHAAHHHSACYHNAPSSMTSSSSAILGPHYGSGGSITAAWDYLRSPHLTLPILQPSSQQQQSGIATLMSSSQPTEDASPHRACLQNMADRIRQLFDDSFGICAEEVRRRDARYFVAIEL